MLPKVAGGLGMAEGGGEQKVSLSSLMQKPC